jgi:hypothetical protein
MDRRTFLSAGSLAICGSLPPLCAAEDTNAVPYYRKAVQLLPELTEAEEELLESLPAAAVKALG